MTNKEAPTAPYKVDNGDNYQIRICKCGHSEGMHLFTETNNGTCQDIDCDCLVFKQRDNCQPVNPVIVQLKKELAEARENEMTSTTMARNSRTDGGRLQHGLNANYHSGYAKALLRAIEIVEKGK